MLKNIQIENVALIDKLDIDFCPNLNVLSGETGAGKSIIIDALNFVVGSKTNKTLIKNGKNFMKVQALFIGPFQDDVKQLLCDYDISFEDDELLISRKMTIDGKNDIRVNGNQLSSSMLKNLTSCLIDIHGQHDHQRLLKEKNHIDIIDLFIKDKTVFETYNNCLSELKEIQKNINKLNGSTENQERMLDLLDYQIKEIENAKLRLNEDDELLQKKMIMLNSEKIFDSLSSVIDFLDGQNSVVDNLKRTSNTLNGIVKFDGDLDKLVERIDASKFELIDIIEILKDKKDNCSFDEKEFNEIDERLDKIKSLKKKYGATIEDVFKFLSKAKDDYDNIINSKDKLIQLLEEKNNKLKVIFAIASQISDERKKIAVNFEEKLKKQLDDLGMRNSIFKVEFQGIPSLENAEMFLNEKGFDEIRFLFSANAGQDLKPLSEIISGGEASRFMLGFKNILAEQDNIQSMVFDEIDTGISGEMGYKVACKLANISKNHQVMSVSHLPQICAMADRNFKISKNVVENNTIVSVLKLSNNDLLEEISRLSGGKLNSLVSLEHSKELKSRCNEYKKSI